MCLFGAVKNKNKYMYDLFTKEFGIDVKTARDKDGRSAMHIAAMVGADLMIYYLSEAGLKVDQPDN